MNITDYKDTYKNKVGLILGNGPSLNDVPRDIILFTNNGVLGSNKIFKFDKVFDVDSDQKIKFFPHIYCAVNENIIRNCADIIDKLPCLKFISANHCNYIHDSYIPITPIYDHIFSTDIEKGLWEGHNVTFVLLQIAYYLGFTTIGLVGVDHRYDTQGHPDSINEYNGKDLNHFSQDYLKPGEIWNLPNLEASEEAYKLAKEAYEKDGRVIYNLTPGSALDVFEFKTFDEWRELYNAKEARR